MRLDQAMVAKGLADNRSQAETLIGLGRVIVNKNLAKKAGLRVSEGDSIKVLGRERYVSRAAYKLASVVDKLKINFKGKVVLDVGSSTGGFTEYALQRGASKIIAVDVGTHQMHDSLRLDERIELHEKTDIRDFKTDKKIDIVLIDVSFISLKEIMPALSRLMNKNTAALAMAKPQFESGDKFKHKGVVKNEKMRRQILSDLEQAMKDKFVIADKSDSDVSGTKGNRERFYLLKKL